MHPYPIPAGEPQSFRGYLAGCRDARAFLPSRHHTFKGHWYRDGYMRGYTERQRVQLMGIDALNVQRVSRGQLFVLNLVVHESQPDTQDRVSDLQWGLSRVDGDPGLTLWHLNPLHSFFYTGLAHSDQHILNKDFSQRRAVLALIQEQARRVLAPILSAQWSLLFSLLNEPHADRRGIYADWLEEHADPLADDVRTASHRVPFYRGGWQLI